MGRHYTQLSPEDRRAIARLREGGKVALLSTAIGDTTSPISGQISIVFSSATIRFDDISVNPASIKPQPPQTGSPSPARHSLEVEQSPPPRSRAG